jgi:hypothetical protein
MTVMFETLGEAESYLIAQGFRLVPDTCDWTNAAGDDAGCYAIQRERYGTVAGYRVEINDGRNVIRLGDFRRLATQRPGAD